MKLTAPGRLALAGVLALLSLSVPLEALGQRSGRVSAAADARCPADGEIPARSITQWLTNGKPLECDGLVMVGDLDLREMGTVEAPFRCTDCILTGSLLGTDVSFLGVVDLSGTRVSGRVDLRGAAFGDAYSMASTRSQTTAIEGATDFTLASFAEVVRFEGAVFGGPVRFKSARFAREAYFDGADFSASADFSRSQFEGDLVLTGSPAASGDVHSECPHGQPAGGRFCDGVDFQRVYIAGLADFGGRLFQGRASFAGARFGGPASFVQVQFGEGASFDSSAFEGGVSYRAVTFHQDTSFQWCSLSGEADFTGAVFKEGVSFFGVQSRGILDLRDVIFGGSQVVLTQLDASDLRMNLGLVEAANKREIVSKFLGLGGALAQIEESARNRGDLQLANQARYQLLTLQAEEAGWLARLGDRIYRWGFGYLVRPGVPLARLAILLLLATFIRSIQALPPLRLKPTGPEPKAGVVGGTRQVAGQAALAFGRVIAEVLGAFVASLRMAWNLKPGTMIEDPDDPWAYAIAFVRLSEWVLYKSFEAAFFLALGNSNPTARQLIQSVIKGGIP